MPKPISVNAVGKPIMITITMSASIKSPSAGSLMCSVSAHAALARRFVDLLGTPNRDLARLFIDVFAVGKWLLDDVNLGDIFQPARPFPGLEAEAGAYGFHGSWQ